MLFRDSCRAFSLSCSSIPDEKSIAVTSLTDRASKIACVPGPEPTSNTVSELCQSNLLKKVSVSLRASLQCACWEKSVAVLSQNPAVSFVESSASPGLRP